jgi:hypothetical protein
MPFSRRFYPKRLTVMCAYILHLRGLYSALSQDGKLVVEDITLDVWGLCFGNVVGVISCLFGPVQGYRRMGPQCLLTPPVSASSIYAAIVCVGGLGSVCYIWSFLFFFVSYFLFVSQKIFCIFKVVGMLCK